MTSSWRKAHERGHAKRKGKPVPERPDAPRGALVAWRLRSGTWRPGRRQEGLTLREARARLGSSVGVWHPDRGEHPVLLGSNVVQFERFGTWWRGRG